MSSQISLVCGDVRNISKYFDSDSYDVVTCNPPYFKSNKKSLVNDSSVKSIARHEISLNLDDVLKSARYLLKNGGYFAMVHRSDRFIEVISKLREYNLEPKRVQFIYPKDNSNSDLFLIEAVKNGKSSLKILPNLVIHNNDGSYKEYIRDYFD